MSDPVIERGYVYALADPDTGRPFYVGATKTHPNIRLVGHLREANYQWADNAKVQAIRSIIGQGKTPSVLILESRPNVTELELADLEYAWMAQLGSLIVNKPNRRYRAGRPGGGWKGPTPNQRLDSLAEQIHRAYWKRTLEGESDNDLLL